MSIKEYGSKTAPVIIILNVKNKFENINSKRFEAIARRYRCIEVSCENNAAACYRKLKKYISDNNIYEVLLLYTLSRNRKLAELMIGDKLIDAKKLVIENNSDSPGELIEEELACTV